MTGYRVQIPPTTELHRREIELRVRQLRDMHRALGVQEVWFETVADVLAYLNDTCGVRTAHNQRVVQHTLRRWARRCGFPLFRANQRMARIASSNVLIMAWLWAHRTYQETRRTQAPAVKAPHVATL